MTTYLVRLKGAIFLIDGDEGPRKRRFLSTRLVDAENQKLAEDLARELISKDPRIKNCILNEESDPPVICIESVREIPAMAYDVQNRSNSFYWEKDEKY